MRKGFRTGILLALLLANCLAQTSLAQETVNALLDRGFVAHWLVCGPFPGDVPGGILGAVKTDGPVLGSTDFMATASGIARIRPQHLTRIPTADGGEAVWQQAGATEPELDLKPFFPASPEGVAYAAFYTLAAQNTSIFLDIQSPLGVRLWVNGFPVKDYEPAPFKEAGLTQVALTLRTGVNLVVLEVPGADYEELARALGVTSQQLTASAMANRPRLRKTSGFALSVRVHPATPLGKFYFIPAIEDAGTFSGGPGDERQDSWLTFYNPQETFTEPVDVIVSTPGAPLPDLVEVEPVAPGSAARIPIPLRIEGLPSGQALSVSVRLHSAGAEAAFTDAVVVRPGTEKAGVVRVITGHTPEAGTPSPTEDERIESVHNQLLTWQEGLGYGFDLRHAAAWYKPFIALPESRDQLQTAVQQGAVTTRPWYAPVDERIVSGPLLWRNLQLGMGMAHSILKSATPQALYWDTPGIAPQSPQLLNLSGIKGFISNQERQGLAPLMRQLDLGGNSDLHRHKNSTESPGSAADLQEMAAVQRRELQALGIPSDILVLKNVVPPPEPFYHGSVASLSKAFPRIVLNEGGGSAFFDEITSLDGNVLDGLSDAAIYMNLGSPGDLLAWPTLKRAQARVARQLLDAEALASLASLQGAEYPHAAMDLANRQLAEYSTPEFLAAPAAREDALDALAGYREIGEVCEDTAKRSLSYLAEKVDTAGAAPLNQGKFRGIVVFNPNGQKANLPVEVLLPAEGTGGFTLLDADGKAVPHEVRIYQQAPLLEFIAMDLPSFGYKTYFVKPEGPPVSVVKGTDLQIENEFLALFIDSDTGAIASIKDKRSGRDLAGGLLNQILFLSEDESRNEGGRELWTSPAEVAPPRPVRIESEHTAFRDSIQITTPASGGILEQRYILYAGQAWVNCETRLKDVRIEDSAIFASFEFPDAGRSLVFGERFGAVVGARGQMNDSLRTHGTAYAGASVPYPANGWAAITPNDFIQIGSDSVLPWEPTIILYGKDPILEEAARSLQKALYSRAIPAILQPDQPEKPDFLWTDATTEIDSNRYLAGGYHMRVVIGSPDQNSFGKGILNQLTGERAAEFNKAVPQGARILMEDTRVPDTIAPVPTLVLAGLTPTQTASLVASLTKAVATGQPYLVPPSSSVLTGPSKAPEGGAAITFPGSMSVSQQRDGRLLLGLVHRSQLEKSASGARLSTLMGDLMFQYAIHPFDGDWRSADVPALSEISSAVGLATLTETHPGALPASQSFVSTTAPGIRLGGLRPAGFPTTSNSRAPFHPRNGFTLLAWESLGQDTRGSLTTSPKLMDARHADVFDTGLQGLTVAGGVAKLDSRPYQVQPLWLLPVADVRRDPLAVLGRDADPFGTIQTRYWDERRGAAPQQNLPLGVLLSGSLEGKKPVVEVVISNHLTDTPIEGMAILSASSGITFGPQQFFFSLAPGRQHVEPVEIAFTADAGEDRAIAVEASFERQTYRDVLMSNLAPYTVLLSRNGAQLRAEIKNESSIHAEGYLDLIASPNHWPELGFHPEVSVQPRRAAVSIPPYKAQTIIFTLSDPEAAAQACIKLAANGKVLYQFFDDTPAIQTPRGQAGESAAPDLTSGAADASRTPIPPPPRRRQPGPATR